MVSLERLYLKDNTQAVSQEEAQVLIEALQEAMQQGPAEFLSVVNNLPGDQNISNFVVQEILAPADPPEYGSYPETLNPIVSMRGYYHDARAWQEIEREVEPLSTEATRDCYIFQQLQESLRPRFIEAGVSSTAEFDLQEVLVKLGAIAQLERKILHSVSGQVDMEFSGRDTGDGRLDFGPRFKREEALVDGHRSTEVVIRAREELLELLKTADDLATMTFIDLFALEHSLGEIQANQAFLQEDSLFEAIQNRDLFQRTGESYRSQLNAPGELLKNIFTGIPQRSRLFELPMSEYFVKRSQSIAGRTFLELSQ